MISWRMDHEMFNAQVSPWPIASLCFLLAPTALTALGARSLRFFLPAGEQHAVMSTGQQPQFSSNQTINEKFQFTIDSIDIRTSAKFFKINGCFENLGINTQSDHRPPCKPWLWPFADWVWPGNRKIRKRICKRESCLQTCEQHES